MYYITHPCTHTHSSAIQVLKTPVMQQFTYKIIHYTWIVGNVGWGIRRKTFTLRECIVYVFLAMVSSHRIFTQNKNIYLRNKFTSARFSPSPGVVVVFVRAHYFVCNTIHLPFARFIEFGWGKGKEGESNKNHFYTNTLRLCNLEKRNTIKSFSQIQLCTNAYKHKHTLKCWFINFNCFISD